MQNGRMVRKYGQIAPASNLRLEFPEEGWRIARRLLEQAAEIQRVIVLLNQFTQLDEDRMPLHPTSA